MSASQRPSVQPPPPPLFDGEPAPWPETPPEPRPRRSPWPRIVAVCLALVLAAVVTAAVISAQREEVYGARADILYVSGPEVPLDVRERVLATHAELIVTRAVLEPIAAQSGVPLTELQEAVSVEVGLNDLLRVTVRSRGRESARALAQAIADRYVRFAASIPGQANVRLLSPAYALDEPLTPRLSRAVAVGLLVGLQLAIVAAVLLVRRSRRSDGA